MQSLWIPGSLVSMNEIVAGASMAREFRSKGGKTKRVSIFDERKKSEMAKVATHALKCDLQPIKSAYVTFLHVRDQRRGDPDNFCGGARKVILDALQPRWLSNDGWKQVLGFAEWWQIGTPGILVIFDPERIWTQSECETLLKERDSGKRDRAQRAG